MSGDQAKPNIPGKVQFGFLGAGNIAKAILGGLVNFSGVRPDQVMLSAPSDGHLASYRSKGFLTTNENQELFARDTRGEEFGSQNFVFLCCKPNQLQKAVAGLAVDPGTVVVSVLAGKTIENVRKCFPSQTPVIRIMCNTAVELGQGICGIAVEPGNVPQHILNNLVSLIKPMSPFAEVVPEDQMDSIGALGGSGIAFVYEMIEALSDGGVTTGLPRSLAHRLAAQTMAGAATMVLTSGKHPFALRDEVTSPAGTTIVGLRAMKERGVDAALIDAVLASFNKSKQFAS